MKLVAAKSAAAVKIVSASTNKFIVPAQHYTKR